MKYALLAPRYAELKAEAAELDAKKRLGKNQRARRAVVADELSHMTQPPPTPRRAPTGERGDFQGNVYEMHRTDRFGCNSYGRKTRRAYRFGAPGTVQFKRSRIQRSRRKRRTGGVK